MDITMITKFLRYKSVDTEKETIRAYRSDIIGFYEYLKEECGLDTSNNDFLSKIDTPLILDWREYMLYDKKYSTSTVNRKIANIKQFGDFLVLMKKAESNFALGVKNIKDNPNVEDIKHIKHTPVIGIEDVRKLILETYKKNDFLSYRDRFVISILCTSGMRIEELLDLSIVDITIDKVVTDEGKEENFYFLNISKNKVKNKVSKRIPIVGITLKYLQEYLIEREKIINKYGDSDFLILSYRGKKTSSNAFNTVWEKLSEKAETKEVKNHSFRKFFFNRGLSLGHNETTLRLIGGWKGKDVAGQIYAVDGRDKDLEKIRVCEEILPINLIDGIRKENLA